MSPRLSKGDVANCGLAQAKGTSYCHSGFSCLRALADFENCSVSQFGVGIAFPSICSSVSNSVSHVLGMSAPAKIVQSIVRWVTIEMSAFHAFWAWANEGQKYETMDKHHVEISDVDGQVTMSLSGQFFQSWFGVINVNRSTTMKSASFLSNSSHIGNAVKSLVSWNWKPAFGFDSNHRRNLSCEGLVVGQSQKSGYHLLF